MGDRIKPSIKRASDEEMRRSYPISSRVPGWYFRTTEKSTGSYLVEGSDVWGRTVSRQGADPDQLLAECIVFANSIEPHE